MSRDSDLRKAEATIKELQEQLKTLQAELDTSNTVRKSLRKSLDSCRARLETSAAAVSARKGVITTMQSDAMRRKEAGVVATFLDRYEAAEDKFDVCVRALFRLTDDDGERLMEIEWEGSDMYDRLRQVFNHRRDLEIAEYLQEEVFNAKTAAAMRLSSGFSWNNVRWWRDAWKWDWGAVDDEGEPLKLRRMLAPDSRVPVPEPLDIKAMREAEEGWRGGDAASEASADGLGAEVVDVDAAILRSIEQSKTSGAGGMATAGSKADPHLVTITGDATGLSSTRSGMSVAVAAASVRRLNQSSHDCHRVALWQAATDAEGYATQQQRMALIRPRLQALYVDGELRPGGRRSGIYVQLVLTGDKPYLCHVLGRRSFAHDFFGVYCPCSEKAHGLNDHSHDILTHYSEMTFEKRCSLALVPLHEALGQPEPKTWTVTCAGKVYTKKEVLALRAKVDKMSDSDRNTFDEKWSNEHYGQWFGRAPLLPYKHVVVDLLHAYINEFGDAWTEAFHSHLVAEQYADDAIKDLASKTRDQINTRISGDVGAGGAGLLLTVGYTNKSHSVTGPKMKQIMRDPKLLADMFELMRPLYETMEAKDHWSVRPRPLDLSGLLEAAAAEEEAAAAAAAAAAKASAPAKKRGRPSREEKAAKTAAATAAKAKAGAARPRIRPSASSAAATGAAAGGGDEEGGEEGEEEEEEAPAAGGAGGELTYLERAKAMFTHQHEKDSDDIGADLRKARALEAGRLGIQLEEALLECIGTKRRRTYGHDMVYGVPQIYLILGKPYLASTEGHEHAHQEMKHMFHRMCSHSSKKRPATQQVLDQSTAKRVGVEEQRVNLPRQDRTAKRTGLEIGAGHAKRGCKCTDDPIQDMMQTVAGVGSAARRYHLERTCPSLLDPVTAEKLRKRAEV